MYISSGPLMKRASLLLLSLVSLSALVKADGAMGFGDPTYVTVGSYPKNVVVGNFDGSNVQGFAVIRWEIDERDKPRFRKGNLVVELYLPDHDVLSKPTSPKTTIAFKPAVTVASMNRGDDGHFEADLAAGDMDGMNGDDLLVLDAVTKKVFIYLNDGKGNFPSTPSIEVDVFPASLPRIKNGLDGLPDPPDYRERPFQIVTGKFNKGDDDLDFAVAYVEHGTNWGVRANQYAVCVYKAVKTPELHYEMSSSMTNFKDLSSCPAPPLFCQYPMPLEYSWDSPFYSVNETKDHGDGTPAQTKGNVFQMIAAPFEGRLNDSLWLRINSEYIAGWDPVEGMFLRLNMEGRKGIVSPLQGPFAVAPVIDKSSSMSLIVGSGNHVLFGVATKLSAFDIDPMPTKGHSGAVVAADFNRDGNIDSARIYGDDLDNKVAGTDLEVAFGDGTATNPLRTGGRLRTTGLKAPYVWWENPRILRVGCFTKDRDFRTRQCFQSILSLGAGVVTIHPNLGNDEQLAAPSLSDFLVAPMFRVGDTVSISGTLHSGTISEITQVILIEDVASMPQTAVLNRADFTIKTIPAVGEVLEFKIPTSLIPGVPSSEYKLKVKNSKHESNEKVLTLLP